MKKHVRFTPAWAVLACAVAVLLLPSPRVESRSSYPTEPSSGVWASALREVGAHRRTLPACPLSLTATSEAIVTTDISSPPSTSRRRTSPATVSRLRTSAAPPTPAPSASPLARCPAPTSPRAVHARRDLRLSLRGADGAIVRAVFDLTSNHKARAITRSLLPAGSTGCSPDRRARETALFCCAIADETDLLPGLSNLREAVTQLAVWRISGFRIVSAEWDGEAITERLDKAVRWRIHEAMRRRNRALRDAHPMSVARGRTYRDLSVRPDGGIWYPVFERIGPVSGDGRMLDIDQSFRDTCLLFMRAPASGERATVWTETSDGPMLVISERAPELAYAILEGRPPCLRIVLRRGGPRPRHTLRLRPHAVQW